MLTVLQCRPTVYASLHQQWNLPGVERNCFGKDSEFEVHTELMEAHSDMRRLDTRTHRAK